MAMDDASIALIAAAASLIGATVGSFVALRIAHVQSRAERSSELVTAVAAFGYAVDRLMLEIGQLPPRPGRASAALSRTVARMPHTDWFTGQLARWSLGRPAMRALDALMASANRLSLVAPEPLLADVGRIPELLGRLAQRDPQAVGRAHRRQSSTPRTVAARARSQTTASLAINSTYQSSANTTWAAQATGRRKRSIRLVSVNLAAVPGGRVSAGSARRGPSGAGYSPSSSRSTVLWPAEVRNAATSQQLRQPKRGS